MGTYKEIMEDIFNIIEVTLTAFRVVSNSYLEEVIVKVNCQL